MESDLDVKQFLRDCSELASQLDSLSTRDNRDSIRLTLENGRTRYQSLRSRMQGMQLTSVEAERVERMLDGLLARLKFLEKRA